MFSKVEEVIYLFQNIQRQNEFEKKYRNKKYMFFL